MTDRRDPSETEVQRIVSGETMLAAAADPVPATSQLDLTPAPPSTHKKPWALVGIAGVALASAVVLLLARGDSDTTKPPPPRREPVIASPRAEPTGRLKARAFAAGAR